MKNIEYYSTNTVKYPSVADFTKIFVYKEGKVIYSGHESGFVGFGKKSDFVEERVVDREAFLNAKKAYADETARLHEQFKADLFEDNGVTGHPKAQKCFDLAWEHGHSSGYAEVQTYFEEFVELIQ